MADFMNGLHEVLENLGLTSLDRECKRWSQWFVGHGEWGGRALFPSDTHVYAAFIFKTGAIVSQRSGVAHKGVY